MKHLLILFNCVLLWDIAVLYCMCSIRGLISCSVPNVNHCCSLWLHHLILHMYMLCYISFLLMDPVFVFSYVCRICSMWLAECMYSKEFPHKYIVIFFTHSVMSSCAWQLKSSSVCVTFSMISNTGIWTFIHVLLP